MGFLDNFFGKEKSQTEKIKEERDKIKTTLENNLKQLGFTKLEINEVIDVITLAEADIKVLKDSLIGTNINNSDPTPIMKKVMDEIRERQQQMAADIKVKVEQIKKRKADFRKEIQ